MHKDCADGVKHVWLLPSITGGRAESARCVVSLMPEAAWLCRERAGTEGGSKLTASPQLTSVGDEALDCSLDWIVLT